MNTILENRIEGLLREKLCKKGNYDKPYQKPRNPFDDEDEDFELER